MNDLSLLKRALVGLYQTNPETQAWPVFYVDVGNSTPAEVATMGKRIPDMPKTPWPCVPCVLGVRDCMAAATVALGGRITSVEGGTSYEQFLGFQHDGKVRDALADCSMGLMAVTRWPIGYDVLFTQTLPSGQHQAFRFQWVKTNDLGKAGHSVSPTAPRWVAICDRSLFPDSKYGDAVLKLLLGLVSVALGNLNAPCQYRTVMRSKDGFGPAQDGVREATKGKPIFRVISRDRLYTEYEGSDAYGGEKRPHPRRGHHRRMWAEAGLDRNRLPDSVEQRDQIIQEHNVREIYIQPTWVGPRQFDVDGMQVEVPKKTALDMLEENAK